MKQVPRADAKPVPRTSADLPDWWDVSSLTSKGGSYVYSSMSTFDVASSGVITVPVFDSSCDNVDGDPDDPCDEREHDDLHDGPVHLASKS